MKNTLILLILLLLIYIFYPKANQSFYTEGDIITIVNKKGRYSIYSELLRDSLYSTYSRERAISVAAQLTEVNVSALAMLDEYDFEPIEHFDREMQLFIIPLELREEREYWVLKRYEDYLEDILLNKNSN